MAIQFVIAVHAATSLQYLSRMDVLVTTYTVSVIRWYKVKDDNVGFFPSVNHNVIGLQLDQDTEKNVWLLIFPIFSLSVKPPMPMFGCDLSRWSGDNAVSSTERTAAGLSHSKQRNVCVVLLREDFCYMSFPPKRRVSLTRATKTRPLYSCPRTQHRPKKHTVKYEIRLLLLSRFEKSHLFFIEIIIIIIIYYKCTLW